MIAKAKEILTGAKDKMAHAVTHLDEELKTYRAGKANPLVFNSVMVDYYGSPTPIPQVASVTTPDAKTLMLQPWATSCCLMTFAARSSRREWR